MWTGGVRVIVLDDENRILMVRQDHPERSVWMVPGGGIEDGESSVQAAVREVLEETGLEVETKGLIWHVEEVSERGQRFVNFFKARVTGGELELGDDPELQIHESGRGCSAGACVSGIPAHGTVGASGTGNH